jgi:hypothetical protein
VIILELIDVAIISGSWRFKNVHALFSVVYYLFSDKFTKFSIALTLLLRKFCNSLCDSSSLGIQIYYAHRYLF